jgi:hypothetical protein
MKLLRQQRSAVWSSTTVYDKAHHRLSAAIVITVLCNVRDRRVPVTTALRVLRLRMEERPPICRVATNTCILNKQTRTADKEWFCIMAVARDANDSSP